MVWRLFKATRNLLVILLAILATVSFATGDFSGGTVMTLMLTLGVALRFLQESRADAAAAKLKAMISVTAAVVRDGQEEEIPLKQLVPGDVINLCAGDMIPADIRLIASRDLFVAQAALTGESLITHVIRTKKIPFLQGRAGWPLTITTVVIICIGMWLPYSPLAGVLGFTHLPPLYWPILLVTLLCYVVLTQIVKMWLMRKSWL